MATDLLFSICIVIAAGGGFYFTTKNRLENIESDLSKHNNTNTEILDRLARIETKLDFVTKM
jgi:hypothetical protein